MVRLEDHLRFNCRKEWLELFLQSFLISAFWSALPIKWSATQKMDKEFVFIFVRDIIFLYMGFKYFEKIIERSNCSYFPRDNLALWREYVFHLEMTFTMQIIWFKSLCSYKRTKNFGRIWIKWHQPMQYFTGKATSSEGEHPN